MAKVSTVDLLELANTIDEQKKQISKLEEELEKSKASTNKYITIASDRESRIRALKLEYGAEYGGDGMFKTIQEALKVQTELNKTIMAENKDLHKRCDAAFAGVAIDADSKKHMAKDILKRLDAIKATVEVLVKE